MLEILKIIAEFITKNFPLGELRAASAKKQKSALGAELFFLYTQLNEIYTLGLLIVREVEDARDRLERYAQENRTDDEHFGHDLKYMVDQQCVNILRLARSLRRLGTELQILDADVYASIVPLLYSKYSIISRILSFDHPSGIYRPVLTFCDADEVNKILTKAQQAFSAVADVEWPDYRAWPRICIDYSKIRSDFRSPEHKSYVDEAINLKSIRMDSRAHIRVEELPKIREYLDERKPLEQLEAIKKCLTQLKASLAEHFSIADVLLDVGKAKGADGGSYLWPGS